MPRPKGLPRTGGRRKGSVNRVTTEVKTALLAAFDGIGGVPRLTNWADQHPELFYPLFVKLLPAEIRQPDGHSEFAGGLTIVIGQVEPPTWLECDQPSPSPLTAQTIRG